ncbi:MAG: alcohol dehydrogenase catalytic domain-containing protein, partial [Gammaproteobacteria bacterium]|nr:alcohol dehydrogenase catalytic domain-containing protein [Gammaproteobacteria bacterium]
MKQSFTAFEYHADARFYPAEYRYEGSERSGWVIFRNGQHYLTLPPGYLLLKTLCCGICSTDIARHNLPFPLPQITGHEVVALHDGINVVVDINAAHKHTGDEFHCEYCSANLENHCPDRLTLGIDRLPGGFSPYLLVPKKAIVRLPDNIDMRLASIIEPFAAALHAVNVETIQAGDSVGIVGPRRLGSLLILALSLWRKKNSIDFKIIAITRSEQVRTLCELAGADEIVDASNVQSLACDVVFDTSGSTSGFELSLQVAKRVVHVKSTNGLEVFGFQHLTEMVINEFSLLSLQLSSSDADDSEITSLFKAVDHP